MALIADAAYLFDEKKKMIRPIVWGLYELIHAEASYTLDAEIDMQYGAKPGQHIGFEGIDGRFLLFEIDEAEDDASKGTTIITATDAAVAELAHQVTREVRLTGTDAKTAATQILSGSGFTIKTAAKGKRTADVGIYYEKRWKKLKELESTFGVRVVAYYAIKDGAIAGRYVDVLEKTYENAGILYERETGTSNVYVTYSNAPITRMYGVGKSTGTEDPPSCVTFRDVVWSKANGDPADKPAGQDYIEDADAIAQYGNGREDVYTSKYEEDGEKLLEETWAELQKRKKPSVSGSASASDMEHLPGQEHKKARMYHTVSVRTKRGDTVEAVIIDVKRNYLRPSLTKITIGEEKDGENTDDLIKKVASVSESASRSSRSGGAAANRYIETKQLIQLNAETIELNGQKIALTASNLERYKAGIDDELNEVGVILNAYEAKLLLYAKQESVDELGERMSQAEIDIDGANAAIALKANQTTVDDLGKRVSSAEIDIDGLNAQIALKASKSSVDELGERMSQAEIDIDGANANILLKANASTVDDLGERVSSAEIEIDGLNSEINLKADKITLNGYVTANEFSSLESDVASLTSGTVQASHLYTQNLTATNTIRLAGHTCEWKSITIVTDAGLSKSYVTIPGGNGANYVAIGGVSLSLETETIDYFSH